MFANETIGGIAKGKGKAEKVIEKASGGSIKDIGEHNVHGVFGTNGACAQHGKAKLHDEYKIGREEKVSVVNGIASVNKLVRNSFKAAADVFCGGSGIGGTTKKRAKVGRRAGKSIHEIEEERETRDGK